MTVCEALIEAIRNAGETNIHAEVTPVAILWPDADRQWEPLLPRLRTELPLLTYGDYDSDTRTGPAIWLRCMIDRTLPEADWPEDEIPVLYLPGVSYQDLRQPADLPDAVKPLAELQYRGAVWRHRNGKDWTVAAFLSSGYGGLELEVAGDPPTQQALRRALVKLADEPVERLRQHGALAAAYFNDLLHPDRNRTLLLWLDDPTTQRQSMAPDAWQAFRESCRTDLNFNPETDGPVTGAQKLGRREGAWDAVWQRFAEVPQQYPNLPARLAQARPSQGAQGSFEFEAQPSSWPQENAEREEALRLGLLGLVGQQRSAVQNGLQQLERAHGERRGWVWARLGQAPLAGALGPLLALAEGVAQPLRGDSVDAIAERYAAEAWRVDADLLDCLCAVTSMEDIKAVWGVADALYRPWLEAAASGFQSAVGQQANALPMVPLAGETVPEGGCLLFADGLRLDVAHRLAERLRSRGCDVLVEHDLAVFPTVTPTAKPAVTPVAAQLAAGTELGVVPSSGGPVAALQLRKLIAEAGYTVLADGEVGDGQGRAWTETGQIDQLGHTQGERMPLSLPAEVERMTQRVVALLHAGWKQVRIVTDHGWLLVPYDLSKEDLAEHRTVVRKGRCARMKPGEVFAGLTVPWSWNPEVRIAVASGTACFVGNVCYEHGGLSPQECVTPRVTVRLESTSQPLEIEALEWRGLRCQVRVSGGGLQVDVRTKPADADSSVALGPKTCDEQGKASVPCDDAAEGQAATVVVLGVDGSVLAQRHTLVGGEG